MAKDVITRFRIETTQYDSKLRDASKALAEYTRQTSLAGKSFSDYSKDMLKSAQAMGQVASGATNTRDRLKDLVGAYNDVSRAYNSLTKDQQRTDFAKAMASSLEQLQQRIKATKIELYSLGDANKGAFGGLGGRFDGMLQVLGGNLMTKGIMMAANFASEIGNCVKQGIELAKQGEGIRIAFERLNRPDILDGLREATHGTVTDLELMKAAVKFNDFRLPLDEMGTLLAFAQQKAKDTGQSVDYMVDSIVTGLGRQSLLILDNLGLSASEIRDRMKQTGDMTKAVGAIIREQMSKAGDYVETAADRATQADVALKNAMEELGRTFQPLTDAGVSMWNSLKIGAINLLNGAVRPLIDAFTEAGRLRKNFESWGGGGTVDKFVGQLEGSKNKQLHYRRQLDNFDKKIAEYQQAYDDALVTSRANSSNVFSIDIAAMDRHKAFRDRTGLSWASDIKDRINFYKKQREEYVKAASAILQPATPNTPVTSPTTKPKRGSSVVKTEEQLNDEKIRSLTSEYVRATDSRRTAIQSEIKVLQERNAEIQRLKDEALGKSNVFEVGTMEYYQDTLKTLQKELIRLRETGADPIEIDFKTDEIKDVQKGIDRLNGKVTVEVELKRPPSLEEQIRTEISDQNLAADEASLRSLMKTTIANNIDGIDFTAVREKMVEGLNIPDEEWQTIVDSINEKLASMELDPIKLNFDTGNVSREGKAVTESWRSAAQAVQSVGQAMQLVEDPAVKVMGIVGQAIATIALTFAQSLKGTVTPWDWIAAAAAGAATMASTIVAIKSATATQKFSEGGIVKGNSYSGDNILAGLNAGEVVLTRAQQGNLAAQLQGSAGTMLLETRVSAEDLIFVLNNNGLRRGYGKYIKD